MNNIPKHTLILIILTIHVVFFFSFPVYASDDIELAGDIMRLILPLTAAGVTVYRGDKDGFIQLSKSFLTTVGTTYALKYSIETKSPDGESHAFPSGHTSMAFSGASFLQRRYGWKYGIPAYAVASLVGWSRIESENHYFKDVLAGAAIGIISTYIFTNPYHKRIVTTSFVNKGQYGIFFSSTF